MIDIFKLEGVSVKKEAFVNILINPHDIKLTIRLADVLVYGWIGENMHA